MTSILHTEYTTPPDPPGVPPLCWEEAGGTVCDVSMYLEPGFFEKFLGEWPEWSPPWNVQEQDTTATVEVPAGAAVPPAPVPIPDAGGLFLGGLACLAIVALFKHTDALESIR